LRYQVDFQTMELPDDIGNDFDLDDYWTVESALYCNSQAVGQRHYLIIVAWSWWFGRLALEIYWLSGLLAFFAD